MDGVTVIGTVAAVCTTAAFLPQVLKIYRTGHARDLSLPMYVIFSFGVLCWLVYGFLTKSLPVIIANVATFILCIYILVMKINFRRR